MAELMLKVEVKVPARLEKRMERYRWIDWSEVERKAIESKLFELEQERKIAEISGISPDDKREIKESLVREVIASCEETDKYEKSMTREEFNKWCDEL